MSAYATAQNVIDLSQVAYPEGIKSPRPGLHANAKKGRYDRDFLLQFMDICTEKPDHLTPPEVLGLQANGGDSSRPPRRGRMAPALTQHGSTTTVNLTQASSLAGPVGSSSGRIRSQRGGKRDRHNRIGVAPTLNTTLLEPAENLIRSQNGSIDDVELVERKVKALLNKLTMEKFDSISNEIITWANRSENEKDGRTLILVARLVFEKATEEASESEMYARLCCKMMDKTSAVMQGHRNAEGVSITGGSLFRKCLLNLCQENLERGWRTKERAAVDAEDKTNDDAKAAGAAKQRHNEVAHYTDEHYDAQKAKTSGPGLMRFFGEMYKLQMLSGRIMHESIKKLLSNVDDPIEEEIESLCTLLVTVGPSLDTNKARSQMNGYLTLMRTMSKNQNISKRAQRLLLDVIELRQQNWAPRNAVGPSTTLARVHEVAAEGKAAAEETSTGETVHESMSHGASRPEVSQARLDGLALARALAKAPKRNMCLTLGPTSLLTGKHDDEAAKVTPGSRTPSTAIDNPFLALPQNPAENTADAPSMSRSGGYLHD